MTDTVSEIASKITYPIVRKSWILRVDIPMYTAEGTIQAEGIVLAAMKKGQIVKSESWHHFIGGYHYHLTVGPTYEDHGKEFLLNLLKLHSVDLEKCFAELHCDERTVAFQGAEDTHVYTSSRIRSI
jgi:hypothetical protein